MTTANEHARQVREVVDTIIEAIQRQDIEQQFFEDAIIAVVHALADLSQQSSHSASYRLGRQQAVSRILAALGAELGVLTIDGEVVEP